MAPKKKRKSSTRSADEEKASCGTVSSFGQRPPPLLKHIQNVLNSYSDGQILKELTQNAEDAGASTVQFLYDDREFGTEKLYHAKLAPHQGSAIYSYNDALFRPEDWEGIQRPSDSVKKKDPLKVGRFGIGFVSVYHMTDIPSILSGEFLAYMDPQADIFPAKSGLPETGFRFFLNESNHLGIVHDESHTHQFEPYHTVFDDNTVFPGGEFKTINFTGTLFRFPLRKQESEISKNIYSNDKVLELLSSFKSDASVILLFLKNIETIKVFTRTTDSNKTVMISSSLSDDTRNHVRTARKRICGRVEQQKSGSEEDVSESYNMTINTSTDSNRGKDRNWFVCTYVSWPLPEDVDARVASKEHGLLGWVGVAMSLDSTKINGRTFCFLPLPPEESSTCLPVHVNGAFAVSPDRRSIKWPSEDRTEDNSALWNQYLIGKVLPKAYAKLIIDAVDIEMKQQDLAKCIYKAWPDISVESLGHWQGMIKPMMDLLKKEKIFYTKANGGKWVDASQAVFDNTCTHAVPNTLVCLLIKLGKPIVSPPDHVYKAVKQYIDADITELTPKYTRQCIRKIPLKDVDRTDRLRLLEYILQDKCYDDLLDIALLPLADKTFTSFACPENESNEVYITSGRPIELFFNQKSRFLDDESDIGRIIQSHMETIASDRKNSKYAATCGMPPKKKLKCSSGKAPVKGLPQISQLTVSAMVGIIRETIPDNWQSRQTVDWTPETNQEPSTNWLKLCWEMLCNDFKDNLSDFPQLPLIPKKIPVNTKKTKLMPLSKNSRLISAHTANPNMDKGVITAIEKIGLKVVHLPEYINRHPQIMSEGFVHHLTPDGVLKALEAVSISEISKNIVHLSKEDKQILQKFLSDVSPSSIKSASGECQRLRMLPIFRSFPGEEMVPVSKICKFVHAKDLPKFATTKKMIGLYDRTDDRLISLLSLILCDRDAALCQMLSHRGNDIGKLVEWIIDRWSNNQSKGLLLKLHSTPFLITCSGDGKLKRPCDLFDPTDRVVSTLWDKEESMFPVDYIDKSHIHILKELGLRDAADITEEDVVLRALRIETYPERGKALNLLRFLNDNPQLVSERIKEDLHRMKWVPALCKPMTYPLKWCCEDIVIKPTDALTSKHHNIVGSSTALVDSSGIELTDSILKYFDWNKPPAMELVIEQLKNCIDAGRDFNDVSETQIICEIYTYFEEHLDEDIKKELSNLEWIWQGSRFVEARKISIERMTLDMAPYVYQVPNVFAKFKQLFLDCGAHQQMDTDKKAMLAIISEIKDKHDKTKSKTKKEVVEDKQLIIRIICKLFSENEDDKSIQDLLPEVLLPDDNPDRIHLYPISEMCYCDMNDYEEEDLTDDEESTPVIIVDADIPHKVCIRLGVIPLSKRLADAEEFNGIEQTGQNEPLTVRLRNILRGYEANDFPKELIQNADDAKATRVKFLIDLRQSHNFEGKLLDPGMSRCHGPALWVQNDSQFSPEDFQNITKLGSQSKLTIPDKIGRFGLGFNSVYHLTDVPSFVSGDRIVFFDPHTVHLGKQIRDKTKLGIMLNFAKSAKQLSRFKGQFEPYNDIFHCDLRPTSEWKPYNGTLFRFPLRTELQARDNEIKNEACDKEKIFNILKHFHKQAENILLFTNHVSEVSVHILDERQPDPKKTTELFRVEANQADMLKTISMITSNEGNRLLQNNKPRSVTKQWIVQTTNGNAGNHEELDARELANSEDGLRHGLNPRGGVACPVGDNTANGLVYCFLPLSIPLSGLPVDINASFSLSSDRRNLKKIGAGDEETLDIKWNNSIMKFSISKSYIDLLSNGTCGNDVAKDAVSKDDVFHFWPRKEDVHPDYKLVVEEFYRMVVSGDGRSLPSIFCKEGRWYDFMHLKIIDPDLRQIPNVGDSAREVLVQLVESEETALFDIPDWLYRLLSSDHGNDLRRQTVTMDIFIREYFFPHIGEFKDDVTDTILLHILRSDKYDELLKSTACIPTTPNGKTRKRISDLICPKGKVSKMYNEDENVFPFEKYRDKDIIQKLCDLGLKTEVEWNDIIERASTVQALYETSIEDAVARIKAIVNYTCHKHKGNSIGIVEFRENIKDVPFLPAMRKPKGYPISWFTDRRQLFSANELYTKDKSNLVGSLHPIVDETVAGFKKAKSIAELFGISDQPDIDSIVKQLGKLLDCDLNTLNIKCVELMYEEILYAISITPIHIDIVEQLKHKPTVLISSNRCFVKGNVCARYGLMGNIYGLLYEFPERLKQYFEGFFDKLGVLHKFEVPHYIDAIRKLLERCNMVGSDVDTTEPLDDSAVDAVLQILTHLGKEIDDASDLPGLLIPDAENILRPVCDLCYNDTNFVSSLDFKICSGKISQEMARKFGVKDIRTRTIMDLSHNGLFSEFGQHEDLSSRIKRILEGYPLGVSVLREMLQNADDAGASRLSLILDRRSHPIVKLPSNNWKHLQGPALCVYNNATFSDADIHGIQKLGSGSKENQADKTGQYGVGFNVVYNITDCPSFISDEETFCLFDPNLKYAPGATKTSPGLSTKKLTTFRKTFTDATKCYLHEFDADFPHKGGTIFRLPLRSEDMASKSEISEENITVETIDKLLDDFKSEMPEILLFLKTISMISIYDIDISGRLIKRYSVQSDVPKRADKERRESFFAQLKETNLNTLKLDCSYEMDITCHTSNRKEDSHRWLISQSLGFGGDDYRFHLPRPHLPVGGVGTLLPRSEQLRNFGHKNMGVYCFLPLPIKSGLPVIVNGHFCLGHESRRDIWNNDDKNDPRVIWNTTLVASVVGRAYVNLLKEFAGRIGLLQSSGDEIDIKCCLDYYHRLFPNPSNTSSLLWKELALAVYRRMVDQKESLPLLKRTDSGEEQIQIYDVRWYTPVGDRFDRGYFYKYDFQNRQSPHPVYESPDMIKRRREEETEREEALKSILISLGINVFHAPFRIYHYFKEAKCDVSYVTPGHVRSFLTEDHDKCTLVELPKPISETTLASKENLKVLVEYIYIRDDLPAHHSRPLDVPVGLRPHRLPLVLTEDTCLNVCDSHQFGMTCTFGARNIFYSNFSHVFTEFSHEFLHKEFMYYFDAKTFKHLSLKDIEQRLAKHLDPTEYRIMSYIDHVPDVVRPNWITNLWKCIFVSLSSQSSGHLTGAFGDWAILPVIFKDEHYLIPLSMAATVRPMQGFSDDSSLRSIFDTKLRCPRLNAELLPADTKHKIERLFSSSAFPERVLSLLQFIQGRDENCFADLEPDDYVRLLSYFERNINQMSRKTTLKELKLFETISGEVISLANTSDVVMIDDNIPKDDQPKWLGKTDTVFIKRHNQLERLYDVLGFNKKSSLQVYTRFIIPCIQDFSDKGREAHLKWIREQNLNKEALRSIGLTSIAIIKTDDGFQTVDKLYDPKIKLFNIMLPPHSFPPSPYDKDEWRELLLALGLIVNVSHDMCKEYAKKIESQIADKPDESKVKSKALLEALNQRYLQPLLVDISTIKFIVPDHLEVRRLFGNTCEQSENGVMFKGSVMSKDAHLIWTIKPVLPVYVSDLHLTDDLLTQLGVILDPEVDDVLEHLNTISTDCLNMDDEKVIKVVFKDIYEYLKQKCNREDGPCSVCRSITKLILPELPFVIVKDNANKSVVVGASLVSEHVPTTIKDVLNPYIYELPKEYANYGTVFKAAGMTEEVSAKQFSSVLKAVKEDNIGGRNPNFKQVVIACVRSLFELLKRAREEDKTVDLDYLYLPDKEYTLIPSYDLVFADISRYERRVKDGAVRLFAGFEEFKLDGSYFNYLDALPQHLQLQTMSKDFREKRMDTGCKNCQECESDICVFLDIYKTVLTSREFRQGLLRLVSHESRHLGFNKTKTEEKIEKLFGTSFRIHCQETIKTQLYCRDDLLANSEEDADCCMVETEENSVHKYDLYIRHDMHPGSKKFGKTLVSIVNGMMGNEISDILTLHAIVTETSPFTIDKTLDDMDITPFGEPTYRPQLGDNVPVESLYLLSQDPFNTFYPGEYVAYQLSDKVGTEPTYIYAEIKSKITPDSKNKLTCKYSIDIGNDEDEGRISVSALDIFKFVPYERQEAIYSEGTVEEIKVTIKWKLEEIWRLPDSEKRKALRRILLQWHTDKDDENRKKFYSPIHKYISSIIEELGALDSDFFHDINMRARQDRTFYTENRGHSYPFFAEQTRKPHPNLSEAQRWMRQAQVDLSAAQIKSEVYEWICFKCCQSAEKALKAAQYAIDGSKSRTHCIISLAIDVRNSVDVTPAANRLAHAAGNQMRMRYPDMLPSDKIPNDVYTAKEAEESKSASREIFDRVNRFIKEK